MGFASIFSCHSHSALCNIDNRNILVNFLWVVIYLALVANIWHETWKTNVLQVNFYARYDYDKENWRQSRSFTYMFVHIIILFLAV